MKTNPPQSPRILPRLAGAVLSWAALVMSANSAAAAPAAQNADFAYVLTSQSDPARPGEAVNFAVTVTNVSTSAKSTELSIVIPNHLSVRYGYDPGDTYTFSELTVAPGASETVEITPVIASGASAPADGTLIELTVRDLVRATTISRTIEVQSAREEELKLSKSVGSVAPGERFTYTLTYHNGRTTAISLAKLRLPVPAGATFVAADAGGTLSNGVVQWPLGNLADAQTGQVQATFTASPTAKGPLFLDATLLDSTNQVLSQASDAMTISAAPAFSYALATQDDTVKPGGKAAFTITVTNRTNSTQSTNLSLVLPNHASIRYGYDPGDTYTFSEMDLAAGASQSLTFTPTIASGAFSPPDGSILNFLVRDRERGAAVSRSIVVQSQPLADLKLSTQGGTVAPLKKFTYTLSYHNLSPATIRGAKLSLPLPAGATFVAADGGGTLVSGVVQWSLGNLPDTRNGQVQATFTAPSSPKAPLLFEAKLRNGSNQVLAYASDVKTISSSPTFAYALATQNDTAKPGENIPLTLTITNLTNSTQSARLSLVVPNHAAIRYGYDPGDTYTFSDVDVAAGASQSLTFTPTIASGAFSPPDGSIIHFQVRDLARAAGVSRNIMVQSVPKADLKLSTPTGTIKPGGNFSYLLTYHNPGIAGIADTRLSLPVPAGATFVSANGGGKLLNGVVSWNLGNTAPGATFKVQAVFKAPLSDKAPLLLHARLSNGSGHILAEASEIKSIQAFPTFSYELKPETATPIPGGGVSYTLMVTNLTNSTQSTSLGFSVPNHTYVSYGYDPGDSYRFSALSVGPRSSASVSIALTVPEGPDAPIDGSIINLVAQDLERGASVSHTLAVNRKVDVYGKVYRILELGGNLNFGKVALGKSRTLSLTLRNSGNAPLTVSRIDLPKGFSGSFKGIIKPGASKKIPVTFRPTAVRNYLGRITVVSDRTSGTNRKSVSGTGKAAAP